MHVADDGADLGVAVSGQRLLDEIDKACLALQGGQKRNRIAAQRRFGGRGLLGLRDRRQLPGAGCDPLSICSTCWAIAALNNVRKKMRMDK